MDTLADVAIGDTIIVAGSGRHEPWRGPVTKIGRRWVTVALPGGEVRCDRHDGSVEGSEWHRGMTEAEAERRQRIHEASEWLRTHNVIVTQGPAIEAAPVLAAALRNYFEEDKAQP